MYHTILTSKVRKLIFWQLISLISVILLLTNSDFFRILVQSIELTTYNYPKKSQFHEQLIKDVFISQLDKSRIENKFQLLANQTQTSTRAYNSQAGLESALFIHDILFEYSTRNTDLFNVTVINHRWLQPSVVFRINPKHHNSNSDKVIVVGCHIDTANFNILSFPSKPTGIDDDLSGVVTLLETIDVLTAVLGSDSNPENHEQLATPIEFHFYSAEEYGIMGSHELIKQYHKSKTKILAMLQQDMTGYTNLYKVNNLEPKFGLVTDYASPTLNDYIKELIQTYCIITYTETHIDHASSDHSSSLLYGYPASYVLESAIEYCNPYIHSNKDTLDKIDFDHVMEHAKLVLSFSLELSMNEVTLKEKNDYVKFSLCDFLILMCTNETWRFLFCVSGLSYMASSISTFVLETERFDNYGRRTSSMECLLEECKTHGN